MTTRNVSLPHRRVAVLLNCLSYLAIFMFAYSNSGNGFSIAVILLCAFIFLLTSYYLYWKTGLWQLGNAPDEQLDERQIQARNEAYRLAYTILGTIFLLGGLYFEFATDKELWLPQAGGQTTACGMIAVFIALTLPSLVLAWTEKNV